MIKSHRFGYDSCHKELFEMNHPNGLPHYLLLLVKSPADFWIQSKYQFVPENSAILFKPNTPIHYRGRENFYNDDWIHFSFSNEEDLINTLEIPCNIPIFLPYIHQLTDYLRLMITVNNKHELHTDLIIDSLIRAMIYCLDSQIRCINKSVNSSKYFEAFCKLRTDILNAPHNKRTVHQLADSLHLSTSYFQNLYKNFFGVSFTTDLIRARIESSKFYLRTSNLSIVSIAHICGYENELHYMRQFKKLTGITPTQYRQSGESPYLF